MGYVTAQFVGGIAGIAAAAAVLGTLVSHPSVNYVATMPGPTGAAAAFFAETTISFVMMLTVLSVSSQPRRARFTGMSAGLLVWTYITFEQPLSGMSMNPARTFGSALLARDYGGLWIYFTAPTVGMLLAAQLFTRRYGIQRVLCAKLHHPTTGPCIFGYMGHVNSVLLAISKTPNATVFQKTLGVNDFYFGDDEFKYPMGHISFVGKLDAVALSAGAPTIVPGMTLDIMATHSLDFWLTSEDLPDPDNRVTLDRDGTIVLAYKPNNDEGHKRLIAKLEHLLQHLDMRPHLITRNLFVGNRIPLAGVAHQNGTVRFGRDPKTSALDANCKAHDVENLYVVDGSFFPSSGAVNPALTIMANALRVGDHILERLGASARVAEPPSEAQHPTANTMPGDPFHLEGRRTAPCRAALAAVRPLLSWLSGLRACRRVYEQTQKYDRDEPFERRALEALDIQPRLSDSALIRIPTEGPLIIASNHPHGAVDGLVLASVVRRTRPDVRVLTNHLLSRIPELTELCFYVDPFGGPTASTRSRAGLRAAHLWLRNGGALVVFPAGEVAHRRAPSGQPVDSPWRSTMARLVLTTGGRVLPVFIDGANTRTFYAAGHLHPALRTALLARELLNKRGATVTIRLGVPFAASDLAGPAGDRAAATASIRRAVEELGQTVNAAAATMSESHGMSGPTNTIPAEVGNLPRESCLVESGAFQVFVAGARHIPAALREIGRLRELTYRAIGEGTGRQLDLDSFDDRYLHLFSWDRERKRIVGAYRIGRTDRIMTAEGVDGLYTRTLFRYDERLIARLSPALELGRSFVRAEYQKHLFRTAAALERDRPVRRESSAVPRTIRSGQHQLSVLGQLAPPPDGVSSAESSQPRSRGAGGSHQPASDESSTAAGHPTVG